MLLDHGRKNILCSLGPTFLSTHLTAYSYKKKKKKNQTETQYKSSNTSPEIPTSENWSYYKEARKINKITNQEEKSIHFQVWQVIGEGDHFPLEEMSLDIIKECCQTLV